MKADVREEIKQIIGLFVPEGQVSYSSDQQVDDILKAVLTHLESLLPPPAREYSIKVVSRDDPSKVWASSKIRGLEDGDKGFNDYRELVLDIIKEVKKP